MATDLASVTRFIPGEVVEYLRHHHVITLSIASVSFTIDDYTIDWREVRELQGVGRCRPATPEQDAAGWSMYLAKFGPGSTRPPGVMHAVVPSEMHFVDYDYAVVTGQPAQVRSRTFQIEDAPSPPSQGAVAVDRAALRDLFDAGAA
jgi:hypothetical protein